MSTEYILLNAEAVLVFTFGATLVLLQKKVGPMVTKALEEDSNRIYEEMSASRKAQIKAIHEAIEVEKEQKRWRGGGRNTGMERRRERNRERERHIHTRVH